MKKSENIFTTRLLFLSGIIIIAAFLRLVPHWPNFTPIASIALFGGALFQRKYLAFIVTFASLFISDLIIGLHGYMFSVYISFALVIGIGILISRKLNLTKVIFGALSASVIFFVITNLFVWLNTPFYPNNPAGLLECYIAAIPFFHYSLMGNLFYSAVFFGAYYGVKKYYPAVLA